MHYIIQITSCEIQKIQTEISNSKYQAVCPPMWDGASCIPLTFAGNTAILPCMDSYQGVKYSALCEYFLLKMVLAGSGLSCENNCVAFLYLSLYFIMVFSVLFVCCIHCVCCLSCFELIMMQQFRVKIQKVGLLGLLPLICCLNCSFLRSNGSRV